MSKDETTRGRCRFIFKDVQGLKLDGVGGGWTQFMTLVVSDKNDGWERRYEVVGIEDDNISFRCTGFDYEW